MTSGNKTIDAFGNGRQTAPSGELLEDVSSELSTNQKRDSISRKTYKNRLNEWKAAKELFEGSSPQHTHAETARAFTPDLDLLFNAIEFAYWNRQRLAGTDCLLYNRLRLQ